MRISDWSSDVCSSDLEQFVGVARDCLDLPDAGAPLGQSAGLVKSDPGDEPVALEGFAGTHQDALFCSFAGAAYDRQRRRDADRAGIAHDEDAEAGEDRALQVRREAEDLRSEEHTSELQSLMRISYAVFCLKK